MTEPNGKPWTMQQIADAAGVSVTTVSHTISGKRPVSPQTAQRIKGLIDEFGYVPDAGARRLQSGRSRMIGLAVPDISNWFFGRIARGVEEMANELDYGLIVCSTANSDPRREQRYFNMIRTRLIDGLIYTAGRQMPQTNELQKVAASAPVVLADEGIDSFASIPWVTSANLDGARQLARHVRELGHTRAVVIAGFAGLNSTIERVAGIRESFPNALVLYGDFDIDAGYDSIDDLLANDVSFTAVFGGNDLIAVGAIKRLREQGLTVPADVTVVGFDDIDIASVITPGLTTVRQDASGLGRNSARLLIEGLEAGSFEAVASVVLPVELIVRGTSAAPPTA
ncbi:LacI family DNA-binding transcriptional regulator [Subtercola boreus]|uniref:Uncharacterized protein n=1 Tax=Subtercola boreus TaxID=120213 RepID=A0A3E0W7X8_9MICO|nr:LacI family DNA-binding transcriptional regulator [Subtercola boreus]RFA18991.1 hypothetical protein B7R23_13385 [Subtercola boreus]RFA19118.1 hypothetical protein B7R24_13395 [Subtercola boreus]RFA25717.1 hypothetical protein B7R25_13495 [Subtercola boreus]